MRCVNLQGTLNHLAHCKILGKLTFFVTIHAIILTIAPIGICPSVFIS